MGFDTSVCRIGGFARTSFPDELGIPEDGVPQKITAAAEATQGTELFTSGVPDAFNATIDSQRFGNFQLRNEIQCSQADFQRLSLSDEMERIDPNLRKLLVAHLPQHSMQINFVGTDPDEPIEFELRARPTFTACSIVDDTSLTKLWWSLDALPREGWAERDLTTKIEAASSLLLLMEAMGQSAMLPLFQAFSTGLRATIDAEAEIDLMPQRIVVSLTDNDHKPFLELLDRLDEGSESGNTKADVDFDGGSNLLQEVLLDRFIGEMNTEQRLVFSTEIEEAAALYVETSDDISGLSTGKPAIRQITGFTYPFGYLGYEQAIKVPGMVESIRTMSGARSVSRHLATEYAVNCEKQILSSFET